MQRVVILGRGGAGKSVASERLGRITGLPVVELDSAFWNDSLEPLDPAEWERRRQALVKGERWILDGDLGPYDMLKPRLARADTVIVFDFGLARCAWRALRRSPERWDFWRWVIFWRVRSRPIVLDAIRRWAPAARLVRLRGPRDLERLLRDLSRTDHRGD